MSFDGSGNYVPAAAPNFPAVSGQPISSTYYNAVINDLAAAMSNTLTRDGQGKPAAAINWNGQNLTGVATFGAVTISGSGTATFATLAVTGNATITGTITASNLSGTNTGNQTITLTGDVTGTGTGSFAATIGAKAVTLAKMNDVATGTVFYRKTAATGVPEVQTLATLKTDLGLAGTNSGDQTITLTGDVTGSGTGSFTGTIAAGAVTLAKQSNVASGTVFYRKTGGAGAPEVQTLATLRADVIAPTIATSASQGGLTPTFDYDQINVTAQASAMLLQNPTGTAIDGWGMVIRLKDNGTARALTYDTQYRAVGVTLPTTTVANKTLYIGMIYNATDTKWDILAIQQEV